MPSFAAPPPAPPRRATPAAPPPAAPAALPAPAAPARPSAPGRMTTASSSPATTVRPPALAASARPDRSGRNRNGRARASRSTAGDSEVSVGMSGARAATSTGNQVEGSTFASARAFRIAWTRSITAPTSASASASRLPAAGQSATMRRSGSSAACGSEPQIASVTKGITGWSRRRYESSASTSVHHVASRSRAPSEASERRTLAISSAQSQYSFQTLSYSSRVTSANAKSASAVSTVAMVAATRLRSQRSPGPSAPGSGARRAASGGIVSGRAPRTNRAAFQILFAKFRAFCSLTWLNRWSLPGVAPWMRAKRSASAPLSPIASSGSTTLPVVFDIFAPYGSRMRPER